MSISLINCLCQKCKLVTCIFINFLGLNLRCSFIEKNIPFFFCSKMKLLWALLLIGVAVGAEDQKEIKHPNGLIVKIIKESKNCFKKAQPGDRLSVHYVGRLDDENGKIFDSSRKNGREFGFQLGAGQVSSHFFTKQILFTKITQTL